MMKFGKLYISKCRLLMIVLYLVLLGLMFAPCVKETTHYFVPRDEFEKTDLIIYRGYFHPLFMGLILPGVLACLSRRLWAGILRTIFGLLLLGLMLIWTELLNALLPMGGLIGTYYVLTAPGICCIVLAAGINILNIISFTELRRKKETAVKES